MSVYAVILSETITTNCHSERNEVKSKNLRTTATVQGIQSAKILRRAALAQDDTRDGKPVPYSLE